jgi:hypothetical protein
MRAGEADVSKHEAGLTSASHLLEADEVRVPRRRRGSSNHAEPVQPSGCSPKAQHALMSVLDPGLRRKGG